MNLKLLRNRIDIIDDQILTLLTKRFEIAQKIAKEKEILKISIIDKKREQEIMTRLEKQWQSNAVPFTCIKNIFKEIIKSSRSVQK